MNIPTIPAPDLYLALKRRRKNRSEPHDVESLFFLIIAIACGAFVFFLLCASLFPPA